MVEGKAYIDLVFRNGLKDYEVVPPTDVWTNVKPVIDRKKRNMFLLRSAASIAVLISVGALAYMWGYETSKERFSAELAGLNLNINEPVMPVDIFIPLAIIPEEITEPTTIISAIPKEIETEIEPVVLTVVAQSDIQDSIYVEDYDVVESNSVIAEAIESFSEIQAPVEIEYASLFLPEYQSIIYNDKNSATAEDNRWSILAMAAPTYYSQFTTSGNELSRQIMASDQGRASYSGGVGFAYKVNRRLSIQSGFYYSALGQELGNVTAFSGFQQVNPAKSTNNFKALTSSGTVSVNNPDIYLSSSAIPERVVARYTPNVLDPVKEGLNHLSNSILQDLSYFELPLLLRYKVIDRTVGVSFVGGVSYNFLVNNSVYTIVDGGKYSVGTTEGLSDLSVSSSFGMGMEYKFSKNFSFNVEPTFRYFLRSSNSERIAGLHTYSLGIFSGIAYKF